MRQGHGAWESDEMCGGSSEIPKGQFTYKDSLVGDGKRPHATSSRWWNIVQPSSEANIDSTHSNHLQDGCFRCIPEEVRVPNDLRHDAGRKNKDVHCTSFGAAN